MKTTDISGSSTSANSSPLLRTQAWRKENDIQVGGKFLHLYVEHALTSNDVSWKADTYDLHHGFEDKEYQVAKGRMR